MNVRDKLEQNQRLEEVKNGIFIVAQKVTKSEPFDTVVSEGYGLGGDPLYLKRVLDLDSEISDNDQIFIITPESWNRMTKQNLYLGRNK